MKEKKAGGTARRPSELERAAYHEAGHAVADYWMSIPLTRVSIVPQDGSLGRCSFSRLAYKNLHPEWDSSDRTRLRLERLIISDLAGHAAEAKHSGRNNWVGSRDDRSEALHKALYIASEGKEVEYYLKWLWERTQNLFLTYRGALWAAVEALAAELLARREVGGRKARKIIREAIAYFVPPGLGERERKAFEETFRLAEESTKRK